MLSVTRLFGASVALAVVVAVSGMVGRVSVASAGSAYAPRAGTQVRLAVMLFTLPDAGLFAVSPADVAATYFGATSSVATYYSEASDGGLTVTGDVFGPYALQVDDRYCSVGDWSAAANAAATAAGVDLSQYTNFAYLFPRMAVCPWAGMADIGGNASYINAPAQGSVGLYHAAHELGHDLGAGHAQGLRCTDATGQIALGSASQCSIVAYGDPFSVMGSGVVRAPSGWERWKMGEVADDAVDVIDSSALGRHAVSPLDDATASTRLLVIHRPTGGFLTIEFRQPSGTFDRFSSTDPAVHGVMIRTVSDDSALETNLVDATPATSSFADAPFLVGQTVADAADGIRITVVAAGVAGAVVDVHGENTPDPAPDPTTPPAAPLGLTGSVGGDGSVQLSWQPSSSGIAVASYRVMRDGNFLGNTFSTAYKDGLRISANRRYDVQAIDNSGNASTPAEILVAAPDTTPPSAATGLQMVRTGRRTIHLSWTAATDNRVVAGYRVTLDTRAAVFTGNVTMYFSGVRVGKHKVSVVAVDGAGNAGPVALLRLRL